LVGITRVSGDVRKRAAVADYVCRAAGTSNVPIVPGAALSLTQHNLQPNVPQFEWLAEAVKTSSASKQGAVEFLRESIVSKPGKITLLTIGPMTNVAALFAAYPDTAGMLGRLVSMAGYFFADELRAEWNVRVDPLAAAIVFSAPVAIHQVVGLDVTLQCRVMRDKAVHLIGQTRFEAVSRLVRQAAELHGSVTLHDPLAAMCIFEEDVVKWQHGSIQIDLSASNEGLTALANNDERVGASVARDVNVGAVMEEVRLRLG
jgi:purine nucleosidase